MRLLRWTTLLTLMAALLAACGAEQITADQIMKRVQTVRQNTKDAHATLEVTIKGSGQDGRFVIEQWMAKSGETDPAGQPIVKSRIKVLEASEAEMVNSEIINDGTTMWVYSPSQKQAIKATMGELMNGGIGAQDPTAQLVRIQSLLQQVLDGSNVEILSLNEPVAGRAAWKVKLTPKPETASMLQFSSAIEAVMWVDQANDLPLKGTINAAEIGTLEGTVQTIEVDKGIDPATFVFTPAPDVKVVDAAQLANDFRPQSTNLEDARTQVGFTILSPRQVPVGVILQDVQVTKMGGEGVIMNYGGSFSFSLVQTKGERGFRDNDTPFGSQSKTVTVRGQEATLITGTEEQKGTLLRWQEGDVSLIIAGTLTPEQATAIAESLK